MTNYNYYQAVREDAREAILEDYGLPLLREVLESDEYSDEFCSFCDEVHDNLFVRDSVTGNASGSYTFNRYLAAEMLADNWDLMIEALHECFFPETIVDTLDQGPEACDVMVRCYLLSDAIRNALLSIKDDIDAGTLVLPDTAPDQD